MTNDCVDSLASVVVIARRVLSGLPSPFRIAFACSIVCGSFGLVIVCDSLLACNSSFGVFLFLILGLRDMSVESGGTTMDPISQPAKMLCIVCW